MLATHRGVDTAADADLEAAPEQGLVEHLDGAVDLAGGTHGGGTAAEASTEDGLVVLEGTGQLALVDGTDQDAALDHTTFHGVEHGVLGHVPDRGADVVVGEDAVLADPERGVEAGAPHGASRGTAITDHREVAEGSEASTGELGAELDTATTVDTHTVTQGVAGGLLGFQVVLGQGRAEGQTTGGHEVGVEAGLEGLGGVELGGVGRALGGAGGATVGGHVALDLDQTVVDRGLVTACGDDLGLDAQDVGLVAIVASVHVGHAAASLDDLVVVRAHVTAEIFELAVQTVELVAHLVLETVDQLGGDVGGDAGDGLLAVAGAATGADLEVRELLVGHQLATVGGLAVGTHHLGAVDEDVRHAELVLGHEAAGHVVDGAVGRGALGLLVDEHFPGGSASVVLGGDVALPDLLAHGERVERGGVAVVVVAIVADLGGAGVDEGVGIVAVLDQRGAGREHDGCGGGAVAVAIDIFQSAVETDARGRGVGGDGQGQGHEGQQGGTVH